MNNQPGSSPRALAVNETNVPGVYGRGSNPLFRLPQNESTGSNDHLHVATKYAVRVTLVPVVRGILQVQLGDSPVIRPSDPQLARRMSVISVALLKKRQIPHFRLTDIVEMEINRRRSDLAWWINDQRSGANGVVDVVVGKIHLLDPLYNDGCGNQYFFPVRNGYIRVSILITNQASLQFSVNRGISTRFGGGQLRAAAIAVTQR